MISARLDDALKDRATEALGRMGLSLFDAVRIFLTRVAAEQAIPIEDIAIGLTCSNLSPQSSTFSGGK
jgi:addiction module RelB/DinJ family antitoxin